jgi:hypothetical protein
MTSLHNPFAALAARNSIGRHQKCGCMIQIIPNVDPRILEVFAGCTGRWRTRFQRPKTTNVAQIGHMRRICLSSPSSANNRRSAFGAQAVRTSPQFPPGASSNYGGPGFQDSNTLYVVLAYHRRTFENSDFLAPYTDPAF